MRVKAFVLIQTEIEAARTAEVAAALKKLGRKIQSVDCVTGPYDIIVVIEAETLEEIDVLVTDKIHAITGVHRTVTCLAT